MLTGTFVTLRPVQESDMDTLFAFHVDIANRGEFFPRGVLSRVNFDKQFHDTGLWGKDEGLLVLVDDADLVIGHIEFYKTVGYLAEYELSYIVYGTQHRRRGMMTEAVNLMVWYLFESKPINRIRLVIHPDNAGSRRLAEKCGFRHEGTARGCWYNKGRYQDAEIYAVLHSDVIGTGVSALPSV